MGPQSRQQGTRRALRGFVDRSGVVFRVARHQRYLFPSRVSSTHSCLRRAPVLGHAGPTPHLDGAVAEGLVGRSARPDVGFAGAKALLTGEEVQRADDTPQATREQAPLSAERRGAQARGARGRLRADRQED